MRTGSTDLQQAEALRRAVTALASRSRSERAGVLTLNQVAVLGRLAVEGPITPKELAAQLRMLPQTLTRPLAALERAGLATRMPDPADGRGALLDITAPGRRALRAEMAPRTRWVSKAMAAVCNEEELRTLSAAAELMTRMAQWGAGVAPVEA